ncbi:hypothetical protein MyNCGM683_50490, partial [Achromobacter xylosoxidans]
SPGPRPASPSNGPVIRFAKACGARWAGTATRRC